MRNFLEIKNYLLTKFNEHLIPQKVGFISTMSRSGTWYNREFFFFFNELLKKKSKEQIINEMVLKKKKIKYLIKVNKKMFKTDAFIISHWDCPGFQSSYHGRFREKWDQLYFYNEVIPSKLRDRTKVFQIDSKCNPFKSKNAKIIFYYRNPLDQCVAFYNAIQKSANLDMNYYYKKKEKKKFKSLEEFIRIAGLNMYLKHYLSFKLTHDLYPKNVLMLTYEDMISNPEKNFSRVLKFLDIEHLRKNYQNKFYQALEMSSPDHIRKIENLYGRSISNGYIDNRESQIKNGSTGNWRKFLDNDCVNFFEKKFSEFEIDLETFRIN